MNSSDPVFEEQASASCRRLGRPRPASRAHRAVAVTWLAGTPVVVAVTAMLSPELVGPLLAISLASGVIAHGSLLPISSPRTAPPAAVTATGAGERGDRAVGTALFAATVASTGVRLLGTVALFLWCRYQMAAPVVLTAGATLGWYALLTAVEIGTLSCHLPDASVAADASGSSERLPPSPPR